jgi:methylmalonyl-CoA epimerase
MDYHDPGLKTVVQVALVTRDIEAAAKRWAAILGVEAPRIFTTLPGLTRQMTYRGQPSNDQAKLAFISVGQVQIELIEPIGTQSSWHEGLAKNGEGIHHIAFKVQDLEKTVKSLTAEGMPPIHRGRYGSDDGTFVYMDSTKQLGVLLELLHSDADQPK